VQNSVRGILGLSPEELSPAQRIEADGLWAAFRIYDPVSLPLRKIEAVGKTAAEALAGVEDARHYEAVKLHFLR
jgi:hypothetical protein